MFNVHFLYTYTYAHTTHTHRDTRFTTTTSSSCSTFDGLAWLVVVVVDVVAYTHTRKSYTCLGELNFYTNPAAVVVIAMDWIPLRQPLIIVCFAVAYVLALSLSLFVCLSLSVSVVE